LVVSLETSRPASAVTAEAVELRKLEGEQAALRRVATLVARGAGPAEVFAAVAEGVASVLGVPAISMIRFEADRTATKIAGWGESPFPDGTHWSLDDPSLMASVMRTGRPARIDDYGTVEGEVATVVREAGIRSGVGAPIVVDRKTWGVVVAFTHEPEPLSADAESRLGRFSELVATAIANAQARDDLEKLADEQAALRRVAMLIARQAPPTEVFAAVARESARILGVEQASVLMFEQDGSSKLLGTAAPQGTFIVGDAYPPHPGVAAEVWRTARPATAEYAAVPGEIAERLLAEGMMSALGVPIVVGGTTWGLVIALSTRGHALPANAEARLVGFSELVATAILNTQQSDELRQLVDEQSALRRVATVVAEQTSSIEVCRAVSREVAHVLGVTRASVHRYEQDGWTTQVGGWGGNRPYPDGTRHPPEPGVAAAVLRARGPARVDYADLEGPEAAELRASGVRETIGVPIVADGELWGLVVAVGTDVAPLPPTAAARLASFTELLATAVSNAEAREGLHTLADEQSALRRVATLVARDASTADVFAAVAKEVAELFGVPAISMVRFEPDGSMVQIGVWGEENPYPVGTYFRPHPGVIGRVWDTGRPARVEAYTELVGPVAKVMVSTGVRSSICAPIVVDGKTWGAVAALSTAPEPLPEASEDRLADFTELVATAIANAEGRDELAASEARAHDLAREQAALRRVATVVAGGATTQDVFAAVAREVGELFDVPGISMVRFEPDGSTNEIGGWGEANPFPVGTRCDPHPGVDKLIWESGQPARISTYGELGGWVAETLAAAGFRGAFGAPIVVDGRTWGAIVPMSMSPDPPPEGAEHRLARFTELVATAIANAESRDGLAQLAEEQAALRRVAELVAEEAAPLDVFAAVAEEVARVLRVPLVQMSRYVSNDTVTVVGAWGEQPFQPGTTWPLDGPTLSKRVLETGAPARIDDYADVTGTIGGRIRQVGIRSGVGVPIVVEGALWGVMMVLSTEPEPLPDATEGRLAGFTELVATAISNTQARDDVRRLADEQAALRRVATLVARGAESSGVLDLVCEETGRLIGATSVNLAQFTSDGFNLTMAGWSLRATHVPTGTRLPLQGDAINVLVHRTGAPARVDTYEGATGELAEVIRRGGICCEVGAPVLVEGQVWGGLIAGWDTPDPAPPGTEFRLANFAELAATAVSNATTRAELIASRARIVAAADEARRRIERNLHDGTQQRLISLGLDLQSLLLDMPEESHETRASVEQVRHGIETVLEEVRELSRGLHPALLAHGGLRPALRALARAAPVPVELEVDIDDRPPEPVETAAYFVVSEALANAAKHARASAVSVTVDASDGVLRATIADDGVGGAEVSAGSGLIGLVDRVEALGGRFVLDSVAGEGTTISIELPLADQATGVPAPGLMLQAHPPEAAATSLLDAAVAALPDALYVVDAQGRIRFLNAAALELLGYEDGRQLLGRPSHDTIHYLRRDGTLFPAAECPLLRPRVTGETVRVEDDCFVRQDGSLVRVAYASAPIALADGRGAVVAFRERVLTQPPA
jgi:PAS domain S-box-containing protein